MVDLRLPFYSVEHANCIWRLLPGLSGERTGVLSKDKLGPSVVEEALNEQTYDGFLMKFDMGHDIQIPNGIAGDFLEFTAANDPLFFLHHR